MTLIPRKLTISLRRNITVAAALAGLMLCAGTSLGHAQETPTMIVMRADKPVAGKGKASAGLADTPLVQADVASIKIGGKPGTITKWEPLLKGPHPLQLYILIDGMISIGIDEQFTELRVFLSRLPPTTEVAVGYMLQGKSVTAQGFTTDGKLVSAAFHVPPDTSNPKHDNGGMFTCLRDLATHWPDSDPNKLRAVFMISDGVDRYNANQGGDQNNPNVDSAAQQLVRAGIQAYSLYYLDPVPPPGRSEGGPFEGQANLDQLALGTNGKAFYVGQYASPSFTPLLRVFYDTLASSSVATVTAPFKPGTYKQIDVKTERKDIKIDAPDGIMIGNTYPGKK